MNASDLRVRSASPEDIPRIIDLEHDARTAAHWSREQYSRIFQTSEPRRLALVIEEAGQTAGFLVARAVGTEWEIENVVVATAARRKGLGTRLLREFLAQARQQEADAVFLEVRQSNRAARLLYQKGGFVVSGRRSRYYQNPDEDAVVYRLSFS